MTPGFFRSSFWKKPARCPSLCTNMARRENIIYLIEPDELKPENRTAKHLRSKSSERSCSRNAGSKTRRELNRAQSICSPRKKLKLKGPTPTVHEKPVGPSRNTRVKRYPNAATSKETPHQLDIASVGIAQQASAIPGPLALCFL